MITGGGSEGLAMRALRAGALDYLVKQQFDQSMLVKTVLHAIEKMSGGSTWAPTTTSCVP